MSDDLQVRDGSDNIFEDLGLPNPEQHLLKAELARLVRQWIVDSELTQAQAGRKLGLPQPDVSDLVRGRLARFSDERMMELAGLAGYQLTLQARRRPPGTPTKPVQLQVVSAT